MVTTTYHATSRKLLAQSREELTRGDVLQASEKGWGAAAHIRSVTGDRDVYRWFQVAEALHDNFYENQMEPTDVGESLDDVERFLDKVEPLYRQE